VHLQHVDVHCDMVTGWCGRGSVCD
jgi:hypothetical protein